MKADLEEHQNPLLRKTCLRYILQTKIEYFAQIQG